MLPVGLIGFMLPQVLEVGFYADPPKNKLSAPKTGRNGIRLFLGILVERNVSFT